jgi:hypothetical protein
MQPAHSETPIIHFTVRDGTFVAGSISPHRTLAASRVFVIRVAGGTSFWRDPLATVAYVFVHEHAGHRVYRVYIPHPRNNRPAYKGPVPVADVVRRAVWVHVCADAWKGTQSIEYA